MPLYEYYCADCRAKFEALRNMNHADEPIACRHCDGLHTSRVLSTFAVVSRSGDGRTHPVAGTGGECASCGTHHCSTCARA